MQTLTVHAPSRAYDITVGAGASAALPRVLADLGARALHIVTDEHVAPHHVSRVIKLAEGAGVAVSSSVLPAGEGNKTLAAVERLLRDFADAGLTRRDFVLALGGGVVGDTAGFAAATYMRGVQIIQLPTTLVALVDSSVGGKTGVDLPEGKNLVGAFHQPSAVLADTDFLRTLPAREFTAGLAEVVKYYALGESALLPLLPDGDAAQIVYLCCRAKAELVARDELDSGARRYLNLGHTFGHAIEKYYRYDRFNHGEAVAKGMRLALETGERLGVTRQGTAREITETLRRAGLDTSCEAAMPELIPLMLGDKKNGRGAITLVLLQKIGEPVIQNITAGELEALWTR
ncbi:MAG: 3-dehydroquinate synthase [Oscillospiraceae bacterium]|jgi:3-dehydroquinate synthase|nr:3-dehydroquinate synthase [Oscillospiraceae bacterium]